jgi:hypothetical protein
LPARRPARKRCGPLSAFSAPRHGLPCPCIPKNGSLPPACRGLRDTPCRPRPASHPCRPVTPRRAAVACQAGGPHSPRKRRG